MTTPTGAAILAALAERFGPLPAMKSNRSATGRASSDFADRPNILRLLVGQSDEAASRATPGRSSRGVGDQSGRYQRRTDRLLHLSALGGRCLGCLYHRDPDEEEPAGGEAFGALPAGDAAAHRGHPIQRNHDLGRPPHDSRPARPPPGAAHGRDPLGPGRGQDRWLSDGRPRFAPEYESCRRLAETRQVALWEVYEAARRALN